MNASRTATLPEMQPAEALPPHHLEPADRTLDFQLTLQSTPRCLLFWPTSMTSCESAEFMSSTARASSSASSPTGDRPSWQCLAGCRSFVDF